MKIPSDCVERAFEWERQFDSGVSMSECMNKRMWWTDLYSEWNEMTEIKTRNNKQSIVCIGKGSMGAKEMTKLHFYILLILMFSIDDKWGYKYGFCSNINHIESLRPTTFFYSQTNVQILLDFSPIQIETK